ncbi:MAG: hypothetical protein LBT38_03500 [Deltaproteobacteria bacterium]|jgi:hypothetical protein|nr:hypothetical protein [Deltaproteobacteria bacterium]
MFPQKLSIFLGLTLAMVYAFVGFLAGPLQAQTNQSKATPAPTNQTQDPKANLNQATQPSAKRPPRRPDPNTATPAQLNKEGPLTQADIDLFIKFSDFFSNMLTKANEPDFDPDLELANFPKTNQVTLSRFQYVISKITTAAIMSLSKKEEFPPNAPPYLKTNEAEKKILQENMPKILEAFKKIQKK